MRPTRPQGAGYVDLEAHTASARTAQTEAGETIGRMIDWCLGLEIDKDDKDLILQARQNQSDFEFSINQCNSYISSYLLLVDFEIKKTVSSRDPLVQLAIWEAGGLLKKRHHGWDTSMPMPGITIDGHHWECYLFFKLNKDLVRPCIPKLHCVITNVNIDDGGANIIWHYLDLERDMANSIRATYSDGVGPDRVHDMVQKARSRRIGAG